MEPVGSMPHSQVLSNNSYPDPNQPISPHDTYVFKVHSNIVPHLRLGLPKGLFPVALPVKILKALQMRMLFILIRKISIKLII